MLNGRGSLKAISAGSARRTKGVAGEAAPEPELSDPALSVSTEWRTGMSRLRR
jgi:hypothetical protein